MNKMRRVNGPLRILNRDFKVEGFYSATMLPYVLDMAAEVLKNGDRQAPRHYLTTIDNELVYLHEEAESVTPAIPDAR